MVFGSRRKALSGRPQQAPDRFPLSGPARGTCAFADHSSSITEPRMFAIGAVTRNAARESDPPSRHAGPGSRRPTLPPRPYAPKPRAADAGCGKKSGRRAPSASCRSRLPHIFVSDCCWDVPQSIHEVLLANVLARQANVLTAEDMIAASRQVKAKCHELPDGTSSSLRRA